MTKDILAKEFFSDNARFADIINGIGCLGEQVVSADDLQDLDTQTGFFRMPDFIRRRQIGRGKGGNKPEPLHVRDLVRKTRFGINFAIVGFENEELLDYSMVLRCLFYDTGEYEKQYRAIRRAVRNNGGKLTAGEYLYGFRKDSRLYPVVTFILYYGEEEWDGATDLHGILDFEGIPEPLREMVPNYRINVIDIRRLKDTSMFHTDVRQVFDFIRYSKDPEQLKKLVTEDKAYQELEEDTYDFVTQYTHADELVQVKEYYKKNGVVNMCEALTILLKNEKTEGRAAGIAEGKAEAVLTLLAELGNIPEDMKERILQETNLDKLNQWLKLAARAESVQEFEENWQ